MQFTVRFRGGVVGAVVVAHSGGGATALSLALAQPHRFRSLLMLAPGVSGYPWPAADPYVTEFDRLFESEDRDGLVALGLQTWAANGADPQAAAQIRSAVEGMVAQDNLLRDDPPAFDRLDQIRAPAAVVLGDRDYPMVVECATTISERIPGCQLTKLPGVDHMLPLREPELLAELITAGLA